MSDSQSLVSSRFYDEISGTYSSVYSERVRYNLAVDNYLRLHPKFASFKNVLDIGSGNGDRITKLFSNKARIVAVEESTAMCSLLRKHRGIERVIESSINRITSGDLGADFDLVTMQWNVLGHISDHISLLELCRDVLKSNGRLVFDVNNPLNAKQYGVKSVINNYIYFNIYPRKEKKTFTFNLGRHKTQVSYSPASYYVRILQQFGFQEIECSYFDYETGKPAGCYSGQILFDAVKE